MPADLIFVRSASWMGRAIRWCTRRKGEAPTYCNHIAGIGNTKNVVEAQSKVIDTPFDEYIKTPRTFIIKRRNGLSAEQRVKIAAQAEKSVGFPYGLLKIFIGHLPDALIAKFRGKETFFFRRVIGLKRFPICSFLWSEAYWIYEIHFGCRPSRADPDIMDDFTNVNPLWYVVAEYRNGERIK